MILYILRLTEAYRTSWSAFIAARPRLSVGLSCPVYRGHSWQLSLVRLVEPRWSGGSKGVNLPQIERSNDPSSAPCLTHIIVIMLHLFKSKSIIHYTILLLGAAELLSTNLGWERTLQRNISLVFRDLNVFEFVVLHNIILDFLLFFLNLLLLLLLVFFSGLLLHLKKINFM